MSSFSNQQALVFGKVDTAVMFRPLFVYVVNLMTCVDRQVKTLQDQSVSRRS
jgi:hypothetical protein